MRFVRRIHLAIVTTHDKEAIFSSERTQGEEQNKQHAKCEHACPRCRWTTRRFSKKFNKSNSVQTCGSCDTCRNKNRERRTQSSRCRKHQLSRRHVPFSKVGIEIVHEGTKRPSNAARRFPNISLSRGITHQDKTAKVHSARAYLLRRRDSTSRIQTTSRSENIRPGIWSGV